MHLYPNFGDAAINIPFNCYSILLVVTCLGLSAPSDYDVDMCSGDLHFLGVSRKIFSQQLSLTIWIKPTSSTTVPGPPLFLSTCSASFLYWNTYSGSCTFITKLVPASSYPSIKPPIARSIQVLQPLANSLNPPHHICLDSSICHMWEQKPFTHSLWGLPRGTAWPFQEPKTRVPNLPLNLISSLLGLNMVNVVYSMWVMSKSSIEMDAATKLVVLKVSRTYSTIFNADGHVAYKRLIVIDVIRGKVGGCEFRAQENDVKGRRPRPVLSNELLMRRKITTHWCKCTCFQMITWTSRSVALWKQNQMT